MNRDAMIEALAKAMQLNPPPALGRVHMGGGQARSIAAAVLDLSRWCFEKNPATDGKSEFHMLGQTLTSCATITAGSISRYASTTSKPPKRQRKTTPPQRIGPIRRSESWCAHDRHHSHRRGCRWPVAGARRDDRWGAGRMTANLAAFISGLIIGAWPRIWAAIYE